MVEICCDASSLTADPGWLSQVNIHKLTEKDLPALEWNGEYKHLRRVYALAFHAQEKKRAIIWVAKHPAAGMIGQIFLQFISDRLELADGINRAHIYSFRIKPPFRDAGLGSIMLKKAESTLRTAGFRYVTLNVAKDNLAARRLYEKHGYQIISHESGRWSYPDHKGEWHTVEQPAWRMQKELD